MLAECNVSVYDKSPRVWGQINAQVNADGWCAPPSGKTITYTDASAIMDDGGTISLNSIPLFTGDNYDCSIKNFGPVPIPNLPSGGLSVQLRILNCVTAGAGGNFKIRFFGY